MARSTELKIKKWEWVLIPAKKVGEPCTCRKKCFDKFTPEVINEVLKKFWENGEYDIQNMYFCSVIERKKTQNEEKLGVVNTSRVKNNNKYCIKYDGKTTYVCKMAFISIHGINEGRIQQHNRKRTSTGVTTDQRCKKKLHYKDYDFFPSKTIFGTL